MHSERAGLIPDPHEAWLGGVCAGLGNRFHVNPTFIRVGFVIAAVFFTKIAIGVYAVAWLLMRARGA